MLLKYARKQRTFIYHPATIDDLPFEVLREAFLYLEPEDLVAPSRVNRSWRPAGQDVQRAQLKIKKGHLETLNASLMCGIQLSRIVFGYEAYSIKHLELDLELVNREYVPILARLVSSTLCTLEISFINVGEAGGCYAILDQFFSQCHGIRNLKLLWFNFGDDPTTISQTIKDGFYRLSQLSLEECRRDLRMFVVYVPILNLLSFSIVSFGLEGDEYIVSAVAISCPMIKRLSLSDFYNSSATLLKFVECCRDIEEISFCESSGDDILYLKRSDIEAIASLPRLKSLNIKCHVADDGIDALSRCKGLRHLALWPGSFALKDIFPSIGRNLVSLEYTSSDPILETIDSIIEHCPNLQMIEMRFVWAEEEEEMKLVGVDSLKEGLKKLSKLKIGKESVRLGTDWKGYLRHEEINSTCLSPDKLILL
jgi:hypothetical protein